MSTFNEQDHPRAGDGRWVGKDQPSPGVPLPAPKQSLAEQLEAIGGRFYPPTGGWILSATVYSWYDYDFELDLESGTSESHPVIGTLQDGETVRRDKRGVFWVEEENVDRLADYLHGDCEEDIYRAVGDFLVIDDTLYRCEGSDEAEILPYLQKQEDTAA